MQLENCSDKMGKLRLIWILLVLAICERLVIACSRNYRSEFYKFLLWGIPYFVLLLSLSFFWKRDKRHIGVLTFVILQIVKSVIRICYFFFAGNVENYFSLFPYSSLQFVCVQLLLIAFWGISAVSLYKGFQNHFPLWNIDPKVLLYITLLISFYDDTSSSVMLSSILTFCAVYLLFHDFSFAPFHDRMGKVKGELEQLREAYEQGYLPEDVYQKRRQDIINRI